MDGPASSGPLLPPREEREKTTTSGDTVWQRLAFAALVSLGAAAADAAQPASPLPEKPSDLYQLTNVWTVHFQFTAEQWKAMEPKGGEAGFGGGGPGRGPGRPGGPGGPGGFGPAMILAPAFLKEGDQDADGKLSEKEFRALGEKWFTAWDKEKTGRLAEDQLRAGLNATISLPGFGPPGGRGPGARPGGMNLQGPEGKRNGLSSAIGVEFNTVHADLEFAGHLFRNVAIRYKGNGTYMQSRDSGKRSFKVDLNKFVQGQKLAGLTKLNFHNNVTDASGMNEPLAYQLYRDAAVPAPRTAYARVYVTVPGQFERTYLGLYGMVEDLDKNFAHEILGTRKGALLKPVTPNLFAYLGDEWKNYQQTYDPKTDLTAEQKQRVIDFCKLVSQATDEEFAARLGDFVDLEELARFMAVMVWLSDLDGMLGPGQNFYLHLDPRSRQFQFLPWDQDHSFGQFGMRGTQEQREKLSLQKPWQGENRFLERVYKTETFQKPYRARLQEFSQTLFRPERFDQQVDTLAAAIRPAVREESKEALERLDKAVAGETLEPGRPGGGGGPGPGGPGGGGPRFGGPGGFMQPIKPIKPFARIRTQSVLDQLAGKTPGEVLGEFGFGRPGGRGGPGGPGGPGEPGGPGGFGPGNFLGRAFLEALDGNEDGQLARPEFVEGFAAWFKDWNSDHTGLLTPEQLRAGINEDLSPFRNGPPGGDGPPP